MGLFSFAGSTALGLLSGIVLSAQSLGANLDNASTQTAFPDSTLYGAFTFDSSFQNVTLTACGKLQGTSGCFGSASLGPFGHVCAMIQEKPGYNPSNGNIVRMIYVFDNAAGTSQKGQHVIFYRRTDNIVGTVDTIAIKKVKTVTLSLGNGNAETRCAIVANAGFVFAASYAGSVIERIDKGTYGVVGLNPIVNNSNPIAALTIDTQGFVNETFAGIHGAPGWQTYNPDGTLASSGTGTQYLVGSPASLDTGTLPPSE